MNKSAASKTLIDYVIFSQDDFCGTLWYLDEREAVDERAALHAMICEREGVSSLEEWAEACGVEAEDEGGIAAGVERILAEYVVLPRADCESWMYRRMA